MDELHEVLIDSEEDNDRAFAEEIYIKAKTHGHRDDHEGVYTSDFLFHMIPDPSKVYWMPADHPIARMARTNKFQRLGRFNGAIGSIVVYSESTVNECVSTVIELCQKYELKIKK